MTPSRLTLTPVTALLALFFAAFAVFAAVGFMQPAAQAPGYAPPITVANYVRFFSDSAALSVLAWTMVFAVGITLTTVLVGYPLAYLIARTHHPWISKALLGLLVMTFLTSAISRAYGWLILLGKKGLLNDMLLSLQLVDRPLQLVYNPGGVFVALLHFTLPFFVLTVFGSIHGVSRRLEEAARDLGARPVRVFFSITVPLTIPAIVNGASLAFSLAISAFVFPLILGGGKVQLISNYIYDQLFVAYDLPYAAASSSIFLLISLAVLACFFLLEGATRRIIFRR
jgi:putative spermidine/putrescine transport system permease protein